MIKTINSYLRKISFKLFFLSFLLIIFLSFLDGEKQNITFAKTQDTIISISAGGANSCAVLSNGAVKCWGFSLTRNNYFPTIVEGINNASLVNSRGDYNCVLLKNGQVSCWGYNPFRVSYKPVLIEGLDNVKNITGGEIHTCALRDSALNSVQCWGSNNVGQLGDGTFKTKYTSKGDYKLVSVKHLYNSLCERVLNISSRGSHTCALINYFCPLPHNYIKCWGWNSYGQLGNGKSIKDYVEPNNPNSLSSKIKNVFKSLLKIKQNIPAETSPVITKVANGPIVDISTGANHTCGLFCTLFGCYVKCWGLNNYGQLGDGSLESLDKNNLNPFSVESVLVKGLESNLSGLVSGDNHNCVIINNEQVKCWGDNRFGQLGDGTKQTRSVPVFVQGLLGVKAISAGNFHTCALLNNNTIKCWGKNDDGQLGDGTTKDNSLPVEVIFK